MKYAVVAPIDILERIADITPFALGEYHLWLAHEVLAEPRRWSKLAECLRESVGPQHIIVDNSVNETPDKQPISIEKTVEAAHAVNAQVVVLPDVIGDAYRTVAGAADALNWLSKNAPWQKTLGVAQGDTVEEYESALRRLDNFGVDWLSLPKGFSERLPGKPFRRYMMDSIRRHWPNKPIHTLGFTDDMYDDIGTAVAAQGIDSAMPVWLGLGGFTLGSSLKRGQSPMGRRPDWSTLPTHPVAITSAVVNIGQVRTWLTEVANERWGQELSSRLEDLRLQRNRPAILSGKSGESTAL